MAGLGDELNGFQQFTTEVLCIPTFATFATFPGGNHSRLDIDSDWPDWPNSLERMDLFFPSEQMCSLAVASPPANEMFESHLKHLKASPSQGQGLGRHSEICLCFQCSSFTHGDSERIWAIVMHQHSSCSAASSASAWTPTKEKDWRIKRRFKLPTFTSFLPRLGRHYCIWTFFRLVSVGQATHCSGWTLIPNSANKNKKNCLCKAELLGSQVWVHLLWKGPCAPV